MRLPRPSPAWTTGQSAPGDEAPVFAVSLSHDPVWTRGRVPNGYWRDRHNRVAYLRWLGKRLGFRSWDDWHGLARASFYKSYGRGLLMTIYNDSPLAALEDLNPDYDWKPWLMQRTPDGYWQYPRHRRRFFDWLAQKLLLREPGDWYRLNRTTMVTHGGGGLLANFYGNSIFAALRDYRPDIEWLPWLLDKVPDQYWADASHRLAYMSWLGRQLGFTQREDWYALRTEHLEAHGGTTLLRGWAGSSPQRLVRDFIADHDWHEWRFSRVPGGFWSDRANRVRFARWMGRTLKLETPADWKGVRRDDIRRLGGQGMLNEYYQNNLPRFLNDCLQDLNPLPAPGFAPPSAARERTVHLPAPDAPRQAYAGATDA